MEDQLFSDPALAQFYDLDNGWDSDLEYCLRLGKRAGSVLDLGCGTGMLAARLAADTKVVAVDPAGAMLDVARRRSGGERVDWVEADARELKLGHRFDLIVMTGHAFQVFLTEHDQRQVLANIAEHLTAEGKFIFDTRNPDAREWSGWTPDLSARTFQHPDMGKVEAWNDLNYDPETGIAHYRTYYRAVANQELFWAESSIKFTPKERVEALLSEAGLAADFWLGDWRGNEYAPESLEIIPVGRLRT